MQRCITYIISVLLAAATLLPAQTSNSHYRGFTVHSLNKKDLVDAKTDWQANQVRYMLCPTWKAQQQKTTEQQSFDKMLDGLAQGLDDAKELGIMVIVDLHQTPMDTPPLDTEGKPIGFWKHDAYRDKMIECWQRLAAITAGREETIWLELCNEPLDYDDFPSYPANLPGWMQQTIDAIRKIDVKHPIVVPTGPGMLCWGFTDFPLMKDPYQEVIYTLHLWQPVNFTHQGVSHNRPTAYPGDINDSGGGYWDKARLEFELLPAIRFQQKHHVRLYVGEFGAPRWAPDTAAYLRDCMEIFEAYGWDWSYHAFREAVVWSAEHGSEVDLCDAQGNYLQTADMKLHAGWYYSAYGAPERQAPSQTTDNPRAEVLKKFLKFNTPRSAGQTIQKILIVGNHITQKQPDKNFAWDRSCGAAASSAANDYAHRLYELISATQKNRPELVIAALKDEATLSGYDELSSNDADCIIIQLGDNFWQTPTPESLQKPYETLIEQLRSDRKVLIVCVGLWGGGIRDSLIEQAAKNQNALFVPIAQLNTSYENHAIAEVQYQHNELNWLPGDRGMKAIADEIWQKMKHRVE